MITKINEFRKIYESNKFNDLDIKFKKWSDNLTYKQFAKSFDNEEDLEKEIHHFADGNCPENIDYEECLTYLYKRCGIAVNEKNKK